MKPLKHFLLKQPASSHRVSTSKKYHNQRSYWEPEIYEAVKEFLNQFTEPSIDEAQLIWNEGLQHIFDCVETNKGASL